MLVAMIATVLDSVTLLHILLQHHQRPQAGQVMVQQLIIMCPQRAYYQEYVRCTTTAKVDDEYDTMRKLKYSEERRESY
jgi:hypothetical protein